MSSTFRHEITHSITVVKVFHYRLHITDSSTADTQLL